MWLLMVLLGFQQESGLPNLERLFQEGRRPELAGMLSPELRVRTDLRPLLFDHGMLSRQQVLMAYDKLRDRYRIEGARVVDSQSDTNYSWLEIYLSVDLVDRADDRRVQVTFAFQFKITASRMVVSRWAVQDIL